MNRSRIFQLLIALAIGIACCLCPACKQKCIVPVPTLTYTEDGLVYKPDSIAGVTSIILNVLDNGNNSVLSDTLTPGDSLLIPDSLLASPIRVQTEYLSASGAVIARDEQIIHGGCRGPILTIDVMINRPEGEDTLLCDSNMPTCWPTAIQHNISWNPNTHPVKKIRVGTVDFLVKWDATTNIIHILPCNGYDQFATGPERGQFNYGTRSNSNTAFMVGFVPNSLNNNIIITIDINSPTTGLPACIN